MFRQAPGLTRRALPFPALGAERLFPLETLLGRHSEHLTDANHTGIAGTHRYRFIEQSGENGWVKPGPLGELVGPVTLLAAGPIRVEKLRRDHLGTSKEETL
jgi:hypothetical protein